MLEPREVERWERLTAAMIRKAGQDDPEAFAQVVAIIDGLKPQLVQAASTLTYPGRRGAEHGEPSYSWRDLGNALGVTRSAAQQRFGRKDDRLLDS
jgi:hypothetical protein